MILKLNLAFIGIFSIASKFIEIGSDLMAWLKKKILKIYLFAVQK